VAIENNREERQKESRTMTGGALGGSNKLFSAVLWWIWPEQATRMPTSVAQPLDSARASKSDKNQCISRTLQTRGLTPACVSVSKVELQSIVGNRVKLLPFDFGWKTAAGGRVGGAGGRRTLEKADQ
jgi:hypothetical protein